MSKFRGFLFGISYFLIYPFILLLLLFYSPALKTNQVVFVTDSRNVTVNVEIADTMIKQHFGLMNRTNLAENSGMLFVFNDEAYRHFWMKNTLIPLDMIFVSSDMKIVDIVKNAEPCKTAICSTYDSSGPAKYVIEVNGGFADRKNIKIGDKIELSLN